MSLTLGLTGMDPATETALQAAFAEATTQLNGHWQMLPEAEAAYVVVDMDSMYGPMSWLRLHAAGKRVIGLTTAPRTQTDFRLGRPFDVQELTDLLRNVAREGGVNLDTQTMPATPAPARDAGKAGPMPGPAIEAGPPAQTDQMSTPAPAAPAPRPAAAVAAAPVLAAEPEPAQPPPPAEPEPPAPPVPPRDPEFSDWLLPGALAGKLRYRRGGVPPLLIDGTSRQYHGPAVLKQLAAYFQGVVRREDFAELDDATWAAESTEAGPAQPLQRLQWFGGLLAGKGSLLPGHDPDGRYKLNKWPQTEREFPKHFRIATAMMKGPATLPEIAAASGIPLDDVADFVNANLVTGFAEFVPEPTPEPDEPPRPTSLLGRLRGR